MARIEKSYKNMAVEEVRDLYNDFPTYLNVVAKEELAAELRRGGVRPFTARADGKIHVPIAQAKRRIDFNFLAALSEELLRELRRITGRMSYKALEKQSGALGTEWQWYLNGRRISNPASINDFDPDSYLWLVAQVPYAVKAQKLTRDLAGHSIIAYVARAMRKKRVYKDFVFSAIYPKIDGARRPTISVRLRQGSTRRIIGGA